MKKSRIFVIVLIWGAVLIQLFINSSIDRDKMFVEAAATIDDESIISCEVKSYAHYDNTAITDENRNRIVKNLAKKLEITDGYTLETTIQDRTKTTTLKKDGANATTIISLISLTTDSQNTLSDSAAVENYILVEIALLPHKSSYASNIKNQLVDIYESLNMSPSTNIYIESVKKGKMSAPAIKNYTAKFLNELNAKEVTKKEFDNYICVYGYSKDISEYVYQEDTPINVNIIYTYDSDEDITHIRKAIPFVDKSL